MKCLIIIFIAACTLAVVNSDPRASGWGGYFQYANVPGWGQYEFGYNRGNHDHFTSRFEQGWGWKFKTKVRWGDKKGGYGEQYFDYQHSPKKGWSHGHHGHHHKGHHHHGSFSENVPIVMKPAPQHHHQQALGSNPEPIVSIPPSQLQIIAQQQQQRRFMVPTPPPHQHPIYQRQQRMGRRMMTMPAPQYYTYPYAY